MQRDNPAATQWVLSNQNTWEKVGDLFSPTPAGSPGSSLLGSDGAHLAETHPNCDSKTWKEKLGDGRSLRKQEKKQPAATSPMLSLPAIIDYSANLVEAPQDVGEQGYHCPSCFKCWKVSEEMPH